MLKKWVMAIKKRGVQQSRHEYTQDAGIDADI